ncbi:MAG: hypothetical protein KGR26_10310 [Cyanobacteria bacterium REEB65]|nr:hypothetical protein [Cyanobacteria bacterium REEB65]
MTEPAQSDKASVADDTTGIARLHVIRLGDTTLTQTWSDGRDEPTPVFPGYLAWVQTKTFLITVSTEASGLLYFVGTATPIVVSAEGVAAPAPGGRPRRKRTTNLTHLHEWLCKFGVNLVPPGEDASWAMLGLYGPEYQALLAKLPAKGFSLNGWRELAATSKTGSSPLRYFPATPTRKRAHSVTEVDSDSGSDSDGDSGSEAETQTPRRRPRAAASTPKKTAEKFRTGPPPPVSTELAVKAANHKRVRGANFKSTDPAIVDWLTQEQKKYCEAWLPKNRGNKARSNIAVVAWDYVAGKELDKDNYAHLKPKNPKEAKAKGKGKGKARDDSSEGEDEDEDEDDMNKRRRKD